MTDAAVTPAATETPAAPAVETPAAETKTEVTTQAAPEGEQDPITTGVLGDEKKEEKEVEASEDKVVDDDKSNKLELKPEKLEIALPEGAEVNPELMTEFTSLAEAQGLNSEQASAVVAFELERGAKAQEAVDQQSVDWGKELAADKDFGGKKWDETKANAVRALHAYGGNDMYKALEDMGLGSFPPFIKYLAQAGAALKEDSSSVGAGGKQASVETTAEQRLASRYPEMAKEGALSGQVKS